MAPAPRDAQFRALLERQRQDARREALKEEIYEAVFKLRLSSARRRNNVVAAREVCEAVLPIAMSILDQQEAVPAPEVMTA